jgi:hypothetical protein
MIPGVELRFGCCCQHKGGLTLPPKCQSPPLTAGHHGNIGPPTQLADYRRPQTHPNVSNYKPDDVLEAHLDACQKYQRNCSSPDSRAARSGPPRPSRPDGTLAVGRLLHLRTDARKDEMKHYMDKAAALIHQYVPPNPEQIQGGQERRPHRREPASGRQGPSRELAA